jgi:subtilisin family serine protease
VRPVRTIAAALVALVVLPAVAWATDDPYRDQQWALDRIGVEEAWTASRGAGVVVAVIDTGVDLDHPDLREQLLRDAEGRVVGLDLVADEQPADRHGHGTLVAGVIAASAGNGEGIAGIAPEARIMPVRALDDEGSGRGRDVDTAIRWAVDHGAHVVNLSLESVKGSDGSSPGPGAPTAAVRYAWERGVIVVAAAGNGGAPLSDYPDDSPVVLVGATDRDDRRAAFSDRGRTDALLAPGVDVVSTWCRAPGSATCDGRTHTYGIAEGTSFAAPHVTGALALLLGAGIEPAEAVHRLRSTAVDLGGSGPDAEHGHGRIDVAAAMQLGEGAIAAGAGEPPPGPDAEGEVVAAEPRAAPDPEPTEPAPEPVPEEDPSAVDRVTEGGTVEEAEEPEPEVVEEVAVPDAPTAVALPVGADPDAGAVALQLVAAAMVGASLALWSSVARRSA